MDNPLDCEKNIQYEIEGCLDNHQSICFEAGAGSGKTYALVESIRYLLKTKLSILKNRNQKIVCITYTNIATQEILSRLGQSDNVLISTIHERLWDMVKLYQNELVQVHKNKLETEIGIIDDELCNRQDCAVFRNLEKSEQKIFSEYIFNHKNAYYQNKHKPAKEVKEFIRSLPESPSFIVNMLSNISNFKKVVDYLIKKRNYEDCLKKNKVR